MGYAGSNLATVGHTTLWQDILYDYGSFLATFALKCLFDRNMIQHDGMSQNCKKWLCRDKYGPNLSYLDSVTNTGPLYAILELIWPILSQCAVHVITCYTRPRSLNSALKWTNYCKLDILDHSWPPLLTAGHTGPVCDIMLYMPLGGVITHT